MDSSDEVILPWTGPGARSETATSRRTDAELAGAPSAMEDRHGAELWSLDSSLGLSAEALPGDSAASPSYTKGLAEIRRLWQVHKYEEALVTANHLLEYFPGDAKVLTMKGTLCQRMGKLDVALASYSQAYELEPSARLQSQIEYLQGLTAERERLRTRVVPGGVQELRSIAPVEAAPGGGGG